MSASVSDLIASLNAAQQCLLSSQPPKDSVNACLLAARHIQQFCRSDPDTALAFYYSKEWDDTTIGPGLSHVLILCINSMRCQFNEHYLQHLIAATLCVHMNLATTENAQLVTKQRFIALARFLKPRHLTVWLNIFAITKTISSRQYLSAISRASLLSDQRWVILAGVFSSAKGQLDYLTALQQAILAAPADMRHLAEPLVAFPGHVNPLHYYRYQGKDWLVMGTRADEWHCVKESEPESLIQIKSSKLDKSGKPVCDFAHWAQSKSSIDEPVRSKHWPFPGLYPVNQPPSGLLGIIDALHNADTDIGKLATQIEKEPAFADFLTRSAASDNRLQLPVTDVKQAIMTYGLERIGDMLVQYALSQRLGQRRYPLAPFCQHMASLTAAIASQIATLANIKITPQTASLWATFLTAPLYTLATLKVIAQPPLGRSHYFSINHLLTLSQSNSLSQEILALLRGWHQDKKTQFLFHQTGKALSEVGASNQQGHALMGISLMWARKWLYGLPAPCEHSTLFVSQGLKLLGLNEAHESQLQESLHDWLFCPLLR